MRSCLAAAAALALSASLAQADTLVALTGDNTLAVIDAKAGKVTGSSKIKGLGPVLGIDVRPADGMLYALASDGTVATVDIKTGAATPKAKLDTMPSAGVKVTVDFNPVADRLRVIGSDGTNLRANVDDGKVTKDQPLKFAETDAAKDKTPSIVAGGYTNSMKGAKETTLYDIDGKLGGIFRQAPPNDGILNTIGALGEDAKAASFDIKADGAGGNTAMLLAGKKLYWVDLASGKTTGAKDVGGLPGQVNDIAVLPAM
jgi:DNA-binding beta-propeller fold protein YncE